MANGKKRINHSETTEIRAYSIIAHKENDFQTLHTLLHPVDEITHILLKTHNYLMIL